MEKDKQDLKNLITTKLNYELAPEIVEQIFEIQKRLQINFANIVMCLDFKLISEEDYFHRYKNMIQDSIDSSKELLGEELFLAIFDTDDCEGLVKFLSVPQ